MGGNVIRMSERGSRAATAQGPKVGATTVKAWAVIFAPKGQIIEYPGPVPV